MSARAVEHSPELAHRAQLGHHADLLVENPAFEAAMKSIREETFKAFRDLPVADTERAQHLMLISKAVDLIEGRLIAMVRGGEEASRQMVPLEEAAAEVLARPHTPMERFRRRHAARTS